MVASISARGGVQTALQYYAHLGQDDYYLRDGEPPGGWAGEGAARLSLAGPVTKSEFEAALRVASMPTRPRTFRSTWSAVSRFRQEISYSS
ncbi:MULTISPECIES: relaxase domain-containing protein [unclassified Afipia]|uniref:relaxase domain-containing protein n=1 Tax=unclassified Afipia TaxID=2642050 RepID=UPI0004634DC7|nr:MULTISPECIES: relaxase domain-containing protein [unclassified Afipia]